MKAPLYNTKLEKLNLYLPLFILALFFCEKFYQLQYTHNVEAALRTISQIFLFNGFHVIFTFIFIFFGIEFNQYIHEENAKNKNLAKNWLIAFSIFFIFTFTAGFLIFATENEKLSREYYTLYLFFYYIFAHYHTVSQNFGVSMIYNQYFSKLLNLQLTRKIYALEKILKLHVMISVFVLSVLISIKSSFFISSLFFFEITILIHLAYLLTLYKKFGKKIFRQKLVFYFRYAFFPLSFISPIVLIGMAGVHGAESLMFSERIFRKGHFKFNRKFSFIALLCLLQITCVLLSTKGGLLGFFINSFPRESTWYIIPFTVLQTTALTHFYVEGFIYKLSNKAVLKNQGQLILD